MLAPSPPSPPSPTAKRGHALEPLFAYRPAADAPSRGGLPAALAARYGTDLVVGLRQYRPTVIANFVTTLDGVVSHNNAEASGGGEISGFFEPDRLVMGLLRSVADVVLIGAGTLRAAPEEAWTPRSVHPHSDAHFAELRRRLGLTAQPSTVVVTASGDVDLDQRGLADANVPVLILTTPRGEARLTRQGPRDHVEVRSIGSERVEASAIVACLGERGARLVLCEGGPHLFGQLLAEGLVDELFLTIAPQVAGRSPESPRLSLVEGTAFSLAGAPWARLADLRRAGDHLFARYLLPPYEGKTS